MVSIGGHCWTIQADDRGKGVQSVLHVVETHLIVLHDEVDSFEYFNDLAVRAAIEIVDANNQQVFLVFGAFRFKHTEEDLKIIGGIRPCFCCNYSRSQGERSVYRV